MTLTIGFTTFTVPNFEAASAAYCAIRDKKGWGASRVPAVTVQDGATTYRVSYNGRIWRDAKWTPGIQPVYCPYSSLPAAPAGSDASPVAPEQNR